MAKKGRVVTTVSISPELKRRMDRAKDVSWSAVARAAFEAKLAEIASAKKEKTMSDVIDRLRASMRGSQAEDYKRGDTAGRSWACNTASASQLRRLESWRESVPDDDEWNLQFDSDYAGFQQSTWIEFEELIEFGQSDWSAHGFDDMDSQAVCDWIRGFTDGAIDIWREVKAEL